jgi:hypothetical protein
MFSSNTRRASTVSDALDSEDDGPLLAGTGAHPIATKNTTSWTDENLVEAIHLGEKVPEILTGVALIGDSGFPLSSDDLLECL